MKRPIYPVTIIKSRYGGAYEGDTWVAFNERVDSEHLPEAVSGDVSCNSFFIMIDNPKIKIENQFGVRIKVGRGDTPQKAYEDRRCS